MKELFFETIDSTNTRLKEMAANGEAEEGKLTSRA